MTPAPAVLPLLERIDLPSAAQPIWDRIAARGPVAPMIKVLANHPALLEAYWQLGVEVNDEPGIPTTTVHLLGLRTCQLDQSEYGWTQRLKKAHADGVDPAKIAALDDWSHSTAFDDDERVLLAFTDHLAARAPLAASLRAELGERFAPRQIVGVAMLVLYYVMNHKYVDVMKIRPVHQ
ncbi:MAG: carboxymuconolactone decarboxylase family protein [Ilumatobacteraceae bacterium]